MNPGRLKTSTVLTWGAGNHTWLNKLCDLHEERPDWDLSDAKKGLFSLEKSEGDRYSVSLNCFRTAAAVRLTLGSLQSR